MGREFTSATETASATLSIGVDADTLLRVVRVDPRRASSSRAVEYSSVPPNPQPWGRPARQARLTFVQAVRSVLSNYARFSGRATRRNSGGGNSRWRSPVCRGRLDQVTFGQTDQVFTLLFSLAVLLPSLAVSVRRLHDSDHSGWWLLVFPVPLAGIITLSGCSSNGARRAATASARHPASAG